MRTVMLALAMTLLSACNRESPTAPHVSPDPTPALAALTGRTIDPHGTPVPNVTIRIISSSDAVVGTTVRTDRDDLRSSISYLARTT